MCVRLVCANRCLRVRLCLYLCVVCAAVCEKKVRFDFDRVFEFGISCVNEVDDDELVFGFLKKGLCVTVCVMFFDCRLLIELWRFVRELILCDCVWIDFEKGF